MYEIGKVYLAPEGGEQLPEERMTLALVVTRPDVRDFWYDVKDKLHLFDIKKEIEMILQVLRIDLGSALDYNFDESTGRFSYLAKGQTLVEGGMVSEAVGNRYDFDQPVWWATLEVNELYRHGAPFRR